LEKAGGKRKIFARDEGTLIVYGWVSTRPYIHHDPNRMGYTARFASGAIETPPYN
jgi:hypothetical protein